MTPRLRASAAAFVAGLCQSGCMVQEHTVESVPRVARPERSAPLVGSERAYAYLVPNSDVLELRVRAQAMCVVRQVERVEHTEVRRERASGGRFIGAAAAFIGGTVLVSRGGSDTLGAVLIGSGVLVVGMPMLFEGETRRKLPEEIRVGANLGSVPCGDRPLKGARVAVRIGARTLEGTSDVAGRLRFRDESSRADVVVFVDDQAVPVKIGVPPTGTLPASEAPARPAAPGTR